jgi:hypothetical protein
MPMNNSFSLIALIALVVATSFASGILFAFFFRVRVGSTVLWPLLLNILLTFALATYSNSTSIPLGANLPNRALFEQQPALAIISLFLTVNIALALLIKLYLAAIMNKLTPEERAPGVAGLREWLSIPNVLVVLLFAAGTYFSFGWNFPGMLILGFSLLLIYPLVNTLGQPASPIALPQAPAEERQRVLALVEAGKITADDGTELLTALAQSQAAQVGAPSMINGPRRIMMLGAAIVMVGFLLPWFTVNAGQAVSTMQQAFSQMTAVQQASGLSPSISPATVAFQITVRGGDVRNGLGWITLAAGLGSAGLPFFWAPHQSNRQHQRNTVFAALAIGSVTLLYLLSSSFNSVTSIELGFVFVMAGYLLLWFGAIRNEMGRRSIDGITFVHNTLAQNSL